jgi:tetratricopeptide (TPR) repeat protein
MAVTHDLATAVDRLTAAAAAAATDPARAAQLAVDAAELLPTGSEDRGEALRVAARLCDVVEPGSAWPILERVAHAADSPSCIDFLGAAGTTARRAGAWPHAERLLTAAHTQAKEAFGANDIRTAKIGHALAMVGKYTGAFAQAADLYRQALDAGQRACDISFQATVCHNIGGLYHAQGQPAAAEPWARRAVVLRRTLPDCETARLAVAADQGALAAVLIALNRHNEASRLLDAAAQTFAEAYGPQHYEIGVIEGNRALVCLADGDLVTAERCARNAIAVKATTLGEHHPELAPTLTTLGTILRKQHRHDEARACHERAHALIAPVVDATHPLIAIIDSNLARCGP